MPTVLITGCSSGFGLDTARLFLDRGWSVVATMRAPRDDLLPRSDRLRLLALDVTDPESIRQAVEAAGPIDVLVNNAGIGMLGVFESTAMETVREVIGTNTLGTMAMTQAVLPQFRQRRSGVIVNISSGTTLRSMPMLAVYTASKAAVNAFTESLALELRPFDIRVHLVLPGRSPETPFSKGSQSRAAALPEAYADFAQGTLASMRQSTLITHAHEVAEAVWRAASDPSSPLRMPTGADAIALAAAAAR